MNKIQAKRLRNVAKALREAKHPERFDMHVFVHTEWPTPLNWCGSPACALGHYAARTDLQKLCRIAKDPRPLLVFKNGREFWWGSIDYNNRMSAANHHFGLGGAEMDELFNGDGCGKAKTPKAAARYIERFVAKKLHHSDRKRKP